MGVGGGVVFNYPTLGSLTLWFSLYLFVLLQCRLYFLR